MLNLNNRCNVFYSLLSNTSLHGSQHAGKGRIVTSLTGVQSTSTNAGGHITLNSGIGAVTRRDSISFNAENPEQVELAVIS